MTNPYHATCAELIEAVLSNDSHIDCMQIARRARSLLAESVAEGPKPVVDYSRVTEIATEAQIRSAAQYLVKKQNCDGDLIPAIEYAIARWGRPTPQPVAASERLLGDALSWWYEPDEDEDDGYGGMWTLLRIRGGTTRYTHWLPANALPIPEATND